MKKSILSAAAFAAVAVSAVAVAPTTSEAIPSFARQTGAACLSCHFQTFPAVNSFGRAFKLGAFTDVGEQALIEDEALSLPSVLNASFVLRAQYTNTRTTTGATTVGTTAWGVPADAVLLMAGRVGSNTGAFVEYDAGAANWQLLNFIDFGGIKGGLNIQNTGFGPTAAIEISNVFGQHGGNLNGKQVSSVEQILNKGNVVSGGQSTSVAAWAGNESFLLQVGGVALADATTVTSPSFVPLVRAAYIASLGDAELMIGGGLISGTQTATAGAWGANAMFLDLQAQGEMGDMSYGVYADFTTTKAKTANGVATNIFSAGNGKADGNSIRLEVKPTHALMLGVGVGSVKTTPAAGLSTKRTQTQVAVSYEIYQNMEINTFYLNDDDKTAGTKTKTLFAEVEALF